MSQRCHPAHLSFTGIAADKQCPLDLKSAHGRDIDPSLLHQAGSVMSQRSLALRLWQSTDNLPGGRGLGVSEPETEGCRGYLAGSD